MFYSSQGEFEDLDLYKENLRQTTRRFFEENIDMRFVRMNENLFRVEDCESFLSSSLGFVKEKELGRGRVVVREGDLLLLTRVKDWDEGKGRWE